jgi:hypothetical protein
MELATREREEKEREVAGRRWRTQECGECRQRGLKRPLYATRAYLDKYKLGVGRVRLAPQWKTLQVHRWHAQLAHAPRLQGIRQAGEACSA